MFSLSCTGVSDSHCKELQASEAEVSCGAHEYRSTAGARCDTTGTRARRNGLRTVPRRSRLVLVAPLYSTGAPTGNKGEGMATDGFWNQAGCRHG